MLFDGRLRGRKGGVAWKGLAALLRILSVIIFLVSGCDSEHKKSYASDPVEKKNGMAFIPLYDIAFLIPEKTWLTGYARNSTDGLVCCIQLHATVPDAQPWSKERNDEMYWRAGPGKKLMISITGNVNIDRHLISRRHDPKYIEETSDQTEQDLRRFRKLRSKFNPEFYKKTLAKYGKDFADKGRVQAGKPRLGTVYYEKVENNKVKYYINCDDETEGLFLGCHLYYFPYHDVKVDIYFVRRDIKNIVSMTDKVVAKLKQFEVAGKAYQAKKAAQINNQQPLRTIGDRPRITWL